MPNESEPVAEALATPTQEGVTPLAAETPAETTPVIAAPDKIGREQAREIFKAAAKPSEYNGPDPLEETVEIDPLEALPEVDPLFDGALADESEIPAGETPIEEPETPAAFDAPATETTPAPEETGRKRININRKDADGNFVHDARERAILRHSDEEGISFSAAERALYGDAPAAKPADPAPAEETTPELSETEIDSQIARLEEEELESADTLSIRRVIEIGRELRALEKKKTAHEVNAHVAEQTRVTDEAEAIAEAVSLYPDSNVKGHPLYAAVLARRKQLTAAELSNPNWPRFIAASEANRLRIAPKFAPAEGDPVIVVKPVVPAVTPKKPARMAPSPAPGSATTRALPAVNAQTISAEIEAAKQRRDMPALRALIEKAKTLTR